MTPATATRRVLRITFAAGWSGAFVAYLAAHRRLRASVDGDDPARRWAHGLLRGLNVDVHCVGTPSLPPPRGRARLVVANHRSPLDIPVLLSRVGGSFLSRGDIAGWPIIGAGARLLGTVFVDRDDTDSRTAAIRAVRRLLAEGRSVCVFPEGTTYAGDEVRPFQAGVFIGPKGVPCEIVPAGLTYDEGTEFTEPSFLTHANKVLARPRTRVTLALGEPMDANQPPRRLAELTREHVQRLVHVARTHHRK